MACPLAVKEGSTVCTQGKDIMLDDTVLCTIGQVQLAKDYPPCVVASVIARYRELIGPSVRDYL